MEECLRDIINSTYLDDQNFKNDIRVLNEWGEITDALWFDIWLRHQDLAKTLMFDNGYVSF